MKNYLKLFFLSLILPLFYSCSEQSTSTDGVKYFITSPGSYWIYNVYRSDSLGNITNQLLSVDSTVITGKITKQALEGSVFTTYSIKDSISSSPNSEMYYRADGAKYYTYSNFIRYLLNIVPDTTGLNLREEWLLFLDSDSPMWLIYEQEFKQFDFMGPKITGTAQVTGETKGLIDTWLDEKSYKAHEYLIKLSFINGTVEIPNLGKLPGISFLIKARYFFTDDIGLIKTVVEPFDIAGIVKVPGSQSLMTRYKIVK